MVRWVRAAGSPSKRSWAPATRKWYYVYDGWAIIAVLDGATGALVESYTPGLGPGGGTWARWSPRGITKPPREAN